MAACGKTIAVYQAVQKIAKEGLFNRHGCHWIKIGLIRDQELLLILQNLCITLNIPLDGNCRTLDSVYAKLKKEFGEKEDLYKRLLVIDDVWNDHLRYLDFAPRSIVTMRIKPERFLDGYIYVKVPANLTEEEAMQVLMKHRPKTDQVALKNNNSVKKLLDHTKCLPLAVDLIGRHGLTGEEDWKKAIELIMGAKSRYTMEYNGENAYGTFNYSIQELKQTGQSYEHFISLGVFKRVKVPVSTIAIYWNLNEHDTIAILETFDSYTLLKYWNENGGYITIHDLIIDYLRQPDVASVDLLKLHQELIAKYFNKYDGNWSKCVGDKYMRDNLIYHVVKTKNKQYLREIINDFNYMSTRMNFDNELYGILYDLKFCCNRGPYQEQVNAKCDVLLRLLEQYRSCIDPAIMDMVQIFLILAEKDNWLYLRAFELAKSNIKTRKAKYWMILDMYSGKTEKANWIKRKSLGKIRNDSSICSSNPRFGPLEIINTKYNGTFECTVSITDSENGTQRWEVPLPFQYIAELKISADGNIVALCERMGENLVWTIYDSNKNLKLIFKAGTKSESQHQKFHSLAFSPDDAPSIMTLSQDRKLVQFWEASGIKIQLKSEVISIQNPIQSCKWIRNGNGAIFLWKLSVCTKCEDKNTRTTSEAIEKQELTAKERGKNQDKQQIEDKNNKEEI
ncbi:Apoptotic protease-activating factor 1, partial [Trichoplax sp. H2]